MPRYRFWHALVAVVVLIALAGQETSALAGTTGRMNGTVLQADTGAPIANAKVTASSPTQTASTTTDGSGHFGFISLAPDTYNVSVEKDGFQAVSVAGTTVFADATATVSLRMTAALTTIAKVTATAAGNLVKRGTTADVYSINATTQDRLSALGGGGGLNSAYSAIASVPGAFVPFNQMGYFQTVHIRGGDYDQVGYEIDGVPVNRSFDNYPSGAASSLGQQELQVYTGASPANSEGQGLAGYINQVIKTGTYPGFASTALGIGTPSFYHKLAFETGGSTPNRMFSYYFGIGGFNQDFRYVDQSNAAGTISETFGGAQAPIAAGTGSCAADLAPTGCYSMLPYQVSFQQGIADRDVVANLHFGIAHHNDGGHDDIQLLWNSAQLTNPFYSSTDDMGGFAAFGGAANAPAFADGYQWTCGGVGSTTNTLNGSCVTPYFFPGTPPHSFGAPITPDLRDTLRNSQEIVKLQYQKNFGSDAFFRIYGYTYYSSWTQNGPNSTAANFVACCASDYELSSHTRGLSATFSKQFNQQNLVSLQGSYTTATSVRDNNTQMLNAGGSRSRGIVMVNANDPLSGFCFTATGSEITCNPGGDVNGNRANFATWGGVANGTVPALATSCNIPGGSAGPCTWLIAENSTWATYNAVTPKFTALSLTDEFRPSDRLLLNLGLRYDQFQFVGADTRPNDPARAFWFKAWNLDNCVNAAGAPVDKSALGLLPSNPCPTGFTAGNMQNVFGVNTYNIFQPRLGGTYTFNPDTVVRFSAGKYAEPPNAAFQQYDTLEEDTPFELAGSSAFYAFGFTTPGQHLVRPPTSLNFDISLEQHLKGTDVSFKLTPFLRETQDQIQQFFLDQKTGFVTGLNVGRQTSSGVEFQLNKGDFTRNGLSGQFSFAYTHSGIRYDTLSNGSTVVTGINADIQTYNALTKRGGGAACYLGGVATSCAVAGAIANPYYNAPTQALINPNQSFATYTNFPGGIQSYAVSYGAPYVATLILSYKHDKLAITPSLQFQGGGRYGAPETTAGINPLDCNAGLAGSPSGDPRYPYGAAGGSPFDATNCAGIGAPKGAPVTLPIPDPYTGTFDNIGSFVQPNQIVANLQLSYDVSPKVTLVGTFANLVNTCWGGTKAAWTVSGDNNVCSYNLLNNGGAFGPVGNQYNPPATVNDFQRFLRFPYGAYYGGTNSNTAAGNFNQTKQPFQFFLEARIKL
jgi:hypothetical protein